MAENSNSSPRCLYQNSLIGFLGEPEAYILGSLCDNYHGDAKTTTRDAWKGEILVMQTTLSRLPDKAGRLYLNMIFRVWESGSM